MDTYDFVSSERGERARQRLETRFNLGKRAQADLVNAVANLHIKDKLVPPTRMNFSCTGGTPHVSYGDDAVRIHPHALTQMASVAGIPKLYVNRLMQGDEWERDLFSHNMNELFHKGVYLDRKKNPTKFLSRNFNRHLASLPLLRAFVVACGELQAQPIEASVSPTRFSLKMFLPYVFEPVSGEYIAVGQCWSNSDFGAGRMKLSLTVMRVSSGTTSILEDTLSRVHIGSVIQDADIEVSDETAIKEVEAQTSAIRDAVRGQLAPEPVNRVVNAIQAAYEEEVPWHRIRDVLGRVLNKKEIANVKDLLNSGIDDIVDLPPPRLTDQGPQATRWWAANVLSWLGSKEKDADRRIDMQEIAGELLGINKERKQADAGA
jgi:hypothetical protein